MDSPGHRFRYLWPILVTKAAIALLGAVTVSADHAGEFTLSGSIFISLIYVVAMIPGAIVAAFTTRWWRWLVVGAGSAFLCLPAVGVAQEEIGSTNDLSALRWVFLTVTSALVFASIAVVAVVTVRLVDGDLRRTVPLVREDQLQATSA